MHSYSSILIHPNVASQRCSGTMHIQRDAVIFKGNEIAHTIPLHDLFIHIGGASGRYVFFTNKHERDVSIYTADKSVLKDTYLSNHPEIKTTLQHLTKKRNLAFIISLSVIVLIVGLIAAFFFTKDVVVKGLASQVPVSWEKTAGEKLFSTLSLRYHFIQNDSLKKVFLKVAAPLFTQVKKEGYPVELYFVKDPTINAFALPGGKVVVQSGLIANAKSWEEVMGVMSHELAHVTERHHIRGIINNIGFYTLLSVTLGDVSALAGTIVNMGGELASLANSRAFEEEADDRGWEYLEKARINPAGLASFFETLKKEHETKLDTILSKQVDLSFLSTHPSTEDRIDRLHKKAKNSRQKYTPLPANFDSFKTALLNVR